MGRIIVLLLGIVLGFSVTLGSVAHAVEGPVAVESSCAAAVHQEGDDSSLSQDDGTAPSQDEGTAPLHFHGCHGHHVGVPFVAVAVPGGPEATPIVPASKHRSLPSMGLRTPLEPPRA